MKRYYKKKNVGGSIFGQVFDKAKQALMAGTKILSEKLPFIKSIARNTAEAVVKNQASKLGGKAVQRIIERVRSSKRPVGTKKPQQSTKYTR